MPYILRGTKRLLSYWRTLGRPCDRNALAAAIKAPNIYFHGLGRDRESLTLQYGEVEAQNLAAAMGTTVANINSSGDQEQR